MAVRAESGTEREQPAPQHWHEHGSGDAPREGQAGGAGRRADEPGSSPGERAAATLLRLSLAAPGEE